MKKEWQRPEFEVLEIERTMANPNIGEHLDQSYPEGTHWSELTWS